MKTFPDDPIPVLKISKFFLIIKDYKKCFEYVTKAHQMDKNNPEAFFIQGFALMETGDTVKAVENYKSAVELNQNYFEAFMQLGDMLIVVISIGKVILFSERLISNSIQGLNTAGEKKFNPDYLSDAS